MILKQQPMKVLRRSKLSSLSSNYFHAHAATAAPCIEQGLGRQSALFSCNKIIEVKRLVNYGNKITR
jgi:hypothetical protein